MKGMMDMLSKRENALRCYRHEKPEYLPGFDDFHWMYVYSQDMERPRNDCMEGHGKDWFGVQYVWEKTGGAPVPDQSVPPILENISEWREKVVFPDLDAFDWEKAVREDKIAEIDRDEKPFSLWVLNGVFERVQTLMGMENAFIAMITETDEALALMTAIGDYKLKLYDKFIQYYKPDIIMQHDDYGAQRSMLISPDLWRTLVKPQTTRFVEFCHSKGVFFEQHSCGLIEPIVPDLCEIGVDSWQGMHVNDVPALQKATNGKLNFFMALNMQSYIAADRSGKLTEEGLRTQVHGTVMECAKGGLYIPFMWVLGEDAGWWGVNVINDEIAKCRETITYD